MAEMEDVKKAVIITVGVAVFVVIFVGVMYFVKEVVTSREQPTLYGLKKESEYKSTWAYKKCAEKDGIPIRSVWTNKLKACY